MPKAILEYDLPEEEPEFIRAMKGSEAISALWTIDNYIRNRIKHGQLEEHVVEQLEQIRKQIPEELLEL